MRPDEFDEAALIAAGRSVVDAEGRIEEGLVSALSVVAVLLAAPQRPMPAPLNVTVVVDPSQAGEPLPRALLGFSPPA